MRYISYPLEDSKELDFARGSFEVDIGFLRESEHQFAFTELFEKTFSENNFSLTDLKVKKETDVNIKDAHSFSNFKEFASHLYSLNIPEVKLSFLSDSVNKHITVKFDNPAFILETK